MSTYYEFQERTRNGSEPVCKPSDLVEWPEMVVTEGDLTEDVALELSLMKTASCG